MRNQLLLILWIVLMTLNLHAQSKQWTIDVGPQDSLKSLIDLVCSRDQCLIAYPPDLASLHPGVTGEVNGNSLEELLSMLFPNKIQIKKIDATKFLIRDLAQIHPQDEADYSIKGYIIDQQKKGIPDILVYQTGENAVISNENGAFNIMIDTDQVQKPVHFQGLGYRLRIASPEEIKANPNVILYDDPYEMETITVLEKLPAIRTDNRTFSLKSGHQYPVNDHLSALYASDLIKKMQLLPGIQADDDLSAQLKIRGSQGNESLIILDGIPLYRVDHFYGIFSAVNGNYFSSEVLYKNALPIQYGGKTGGMLTVNSPSEVLRLKGIAEIDLLTGALTMFTPFRKNLTWSLGARTSYLNAADINAFDLTQTDANFYQINNRSITRSETFQTNPKFNFSDLNTKITWNAGKSLKVDLNYYASDDKLENNYDLLYSSQINRFRATTSEVYRNHEQWVNHGSSFNIRWQLSPNWQLHSNAFYSSYTSDASIQSLLKIDSRERTISSGFSNLAEGKIQTGGAMIYLHKSSAKQNLVTGLDWKVTQANYHFEEDDLLLLSGLDQGREVTVFAENSWSNNRVHLTVGSRATYYSPTGKIYVDPKIQFSLAISDYFTLKASSHLAHQFVRELNYENRLGQSSNYLILSNSGAYPVGMSLQFMTGFSFKKSSWNVDVELYQKHLEGVLEYSLQIPGFNANLGFNRTRSYQILHGSGQVMGLDLLLSKNIKNYHGWLAYTLSKSTRMFEQIRFNLPFPAQDDRRHQFKFINSYDLGKFILSLNFIYSSGKPYLATNEIPGESDRRQFGSRAFIRNLPAYSRIDLGLDYQFNLFSKKATFGATCFNLTDRDNVKYLQYIYSVPLDNAAGKQINTILGTQTSLLGRTPNLRFRLEF